MIVPVAVEARVGLPCKLTVHFLDNLVSSNEQRFLTSLVRWFSGSVRTPLAFSATSDNLCFVTLENNRAGFTGVAVENLSICIIGFFLHSAQT
jgi:hypothetical protein